MTREQALIKACFLLRKQDKEESLAKFLLQYIFDEDSNEFNKNLHKNISKDIEKLYFDLIDEHIKKNKPLSHLVGFDYFYGRKFKVNSNVLSPRMETEELVYKVIEHVNKNYNNEKIKILDLCTGSGIIGITLYKELTNVSVTASDISEEALEIARENAINNGANINYIKSDLLENIYDDYDIIISNPPYISLDEKIFLNSNVLNYDPHIALFAEENGYYFYRNILESVDNHLKENGTIFFEIGYNQKDGLELLAKKNKFTIEVYKDINGKDRIVKLNKI